MGKKLTADKIKVLEENANILMEQGASQGDIDLMTSEFIEEFGIDDAMPEKKKEVQGLNVGVGTSVGSSVKLPVSSIKTEQNVGLSPSGKKGIDILRGASVKPISPTKTAIPQPTKKKQSKVEELRKSIQQKIAVGEPLTIDEVSEVRELSSDVLLPLDNLKDAEINTLLVGAQNKQRQQLISKSRNDQYQRELKDRIVSGSILPEDIQSMYDVSGFAPPDTDFEKLANNWNAENIKIKQTIDKGLLDESFKLDSYISDLDARIKSLESNKSKQLTETRRSIKTEMDIQAQSAMDSAINNLKSIKYKAQQYLDYLSDKAIESSKNDIVKKINNIQGVRDENGLIQDTRQLEGIIDEYISTQPIDKQNLLLRKKPYLVESLVATEYIIPKANASFYKEAKGIISDVPDSAKQLFKRVTGEIDVKDGEEKYYDTQQQFAIANNAASLYFMDEVSKANQAFESIISLPNVNNVLGAQMQQLKDEYDAGRISATEYKMKRLQALTLNPSTSGYAKEYIRKIQNAQERYEDKINKFLQSKIPDYSKFITVDERGDVVSVAGMKPIDFVQKMTDLQTAKTESLVNAELQYRNDVDKRAVERKSEIFGDGITGWMKSNFAKGTHSLFESLWRWAYDNTGIPFFDETRRGASAQLYDASIPFQSKDVQDIMDIEAGDYAKALNPLYITGVAAESAPYMLGTMAAGLVTGGLAEGALLGVGLSEGVGAALTLSRAGRVAQKAIAAISNGSSDAFLNMTNNYNELVKEGYSKEQAKKIAFDAFKNELPVDILSGVVEMDALFRATSKPTLKNVIKSGLGKGASILIEEPIQEVYQGYSLEKAKGTNKTLSEYAFFDKEGFNNLVGGAAGGVGTSAITNALGIAKNAISWNRLYNVSTADMQNAVRYAGITQMVTNPSEIKNSINLDVLKSAQSLAQQKYQSTPSSERVNKEQAKNEYINRTIAYVYGKSLNNYLQNGLNIEDIHEHYKAHNQSISQAYSTLAELASEANKSMYQKQSDYYASLAQKSEIGKQTPIYSLITPKGRIFISEQTAKTLAEGSIQQKNDSFDKAVRAGDIIGIQVVDDSQTAQSLIKKFDDAKLSQKLAVQQSQGGATEVGQPTQTNVQTPIEGTTEIPTREGVIDEPNISPESATSTDKEQAEVLGVGTETIGGEVTEQPEQQPTTSSQSEISKVGSVVGGENPALKDVESTAKALREKVDRNDKQFDELVNLTPTEYFGKENKYGMDSISEAYHKAKADGSNPELVKAVEQSIKATPQAGVVGVEVEIKNEGKAEVPTKENVTERLNINNPFYKKVEDALVKLGLIEKYNPETGTGDVVGGYAQQTTDGGFSVGKMLFSQDGSISYFDGDVKVSFDKNGNVISENTKEAKQKAVSLEIEGKKEQITNLEKTRDSEAFKYKEVTETDVLGNKKKGKRLKTEQELKESTDKINAAIDKAKSELSDLEQSLQAPPQAGSVVGGDVVEPKGYADATDAYKATELGSSEDAKNKKQALVEQAETEEGKKFVESEVSKLEKNDDGTITVFRSGTLQEGHNPATTSRKMAETIASERKKQGLSSDIIEVRVNPSDISVVVKGIEREVFVKVDKTNKERLDKNTLQKQKTKSELLAEKDEVQKELDKTIKALADSEKAFNDGTYPFSENVFKDSNEKQKLKIKNLEWKLFKIERDLRATPKEETKQPIEIDESTPFDLSTALQTKKEEQDAIQKQSTTEEVLLNERPEMGLQKVGEGNAQVEAVAEQVTKEEEVKPSFAPKNYIEEVTGIEGVVTLSGLNEEQRQELIADRVRLTSLSPQKKLENDIVKMMRRHNSLRKNSRERPMVRLELIKLLNQYNKTYPNNPLSIRGNIQVIKQVKSKKLKKTVFKKLGATNTNQSNYSIQENAKTFYDRSDEFQRKFIELIDLDIPFEFRGDGNKKFSQKMIDEAIGDIYNGIPSWMATTVLDTIQRAIDDNRIQYGGTSMEDYAFYPLADAVNEAKDNRYEEDLAGASNEELLKIYENEILAQQELDNIIQQEYEREFEAESDDEYGYAKQPAIEQPRTIIKTNQEGNNQRENKESPISERKIQIDETSKITTNRETDENLVGGNQADIPTDADGNRQREEETSANTSEQNQEVLGIGAETTSPILSEMDKEVIQAMKPTFEMEFIPNAKFLNTSAPMENKIAQDVLKRRYQTLKKLLECL